MLTEPFPIKCIIPHKVEGLPAQGSVGKFTNRLCKYSELISDMKKTSAANSSFSLLSKALKNELHLCNREDRKKEDKSIIVEHRYTIQTQIKGKTHGEKMKTHQNDDKELYGLIYLTRRSGIFLVKTPLMTINELVFSTR